MTSPGWIASGLPATLGQLAEVGEDPTIVMPRIIDAVEEAAPAAAPAATPPVEPRTQPPPSIQPPEPPPSTQPGHAAQPPAADEPMRTARTSGLVRAGAMMAVATIVSRATGFLSKALLLAVIGVSAVNDAYTMANTLPNIVFELLLGGVLTSVAIPLLSRARADPDRGQEYTNRLVTTATAGLLAATLLAMAAAPLLTGLYLSGNSGAVDSGLATRFAYLLLPQIFFYGLAALFGAILNTKERFAAPAWAPVANNLVVIGVGILLAISTKGHLSALTSLSRDQLLLLGIGTTMGIVVQAAVLLPSLRRSGFRYRFRWGGDPRMREAGALMVWAVIYVVISQIGYVVTTRVASGADAGLLTLYQYGSMLFQLPYGILGVSLLTAIMPRMSRHAADGQMDAVKWDMSVANRLSAIALLPVSAAMIALAGPLAVVTAKYGRVQPEDTEILAHTLAAFAIGLLPLAVTLVQMRVFYAMKDARTPAVINLVMVIVRVPVLVACTRLPDEWVVPGLAGAMTVSYLVGVVVGEVWLRARFGRMGSGHTMATVGKMALASAVGGVAAWFVTTRLLRLGDAAVGTALVELLIGAAVGLLIVGGVAVLLRVRELDPLLARVPVLRRAARPATAPDEHISPVRAASPGYSAKSGTMGVAAATTTAPLSPTKGQVTVTDQHGDGPTQHGATPDPSTVATTAAAALTSATGTDPSRDAGTSNGPSSGNASATDRSMTRPAIRPVPAATTPTAFAPGAVIGERYRLVTLIATDAAGNRFWRARDTVLPRDMAVTLLPEGPATSATVARTLRAGRLHHIGLPQTLDVGTAGDQAYVVGQWVDGATLTDLLTGGPLEPDVASSITAKISDAVADAHRNGIALGAVHPSLVRVNFDGQVRLSHVIAHANATTDADISAVGALLYLMLTGTWPLAAADGAPSLRQAPTRRGREIPANELNANVPPALAALAERTLHPDDPQGIHAVSAITALLRPPPTPAAVQTGPRPAARPQVDEPVPARVLNPAERRLVRERRAKLSIAAIVLAAFAALIVIVVAAVTKQFMASIAEPVDQGVRPLDITTSASTTRTVGTTTSAAAPTTSSAASSSQETSGPSPSAAVTTTSSPSIAPPAKLTIADAGVWDPQGKPPKDYESYVDRAYDGDPSTFWLTWVYKQQFGRATGGLKDGVGLILTFGKAITPSDVTVSTSTPGTTVQIRTANSANPTLESTQVLGTATLDADPVTINLSNAPSSKYLIVFVTKLAPYGNQWQSNITEITVDGH
jgi:putative peptidoglycan lipid II flippase